MRNKLNNLAYLRITFIQDRYNIVDKSGATVPANYIIFNSKFDNYELRLARA